MCIVMVFMYVVYSFLINFHGYLTNISNPNFDLIPCRPKEFGTHTCYQGVRGLSEPRPPSNSEKVNSLKTKFWQWVHKDLSVSQKIFLLILLFYCLHCQHDNSRCFFKLFTPF